MRAAAVMGAAWIAAGARTASSVVSRGSMRLVNRKTAGGAAHERPALEALSSAADAMMNSSQS